MIISDILNIAAPIFAIILGFLLGQYAERRRQSLVVRSELLKPIEEWLSGTEKLIGILGDTLSSVLLNSPLPVTYNLEERRKVSQFMIEKSNLAFGILQSEILRTWQTRKLAKELRETINMFDVIIKTQLLPMDTEILDCARTDGLSTELVAQIGQLKLGLDSLVQRAHSLISKIKTSLI